MKVLVDTSVWLDALNEKGKSANSLSDKLSSLIDSEHAILLTGIILFEVVRGFRASKERNKLIERLSWFPLLELSRDDYLYAADLSAACRAKGVTTSTADALIAAAAIRYDCQLFTGDKDFQRIARLVPLKLYS
ncbi:MAG: PIN domain-containing protein [Candidatus Obscuribacterales bacterium]|nr:PIN domain-containing protein [Candidatus Obscuribacterales bacterium]